MSDLLPVALSLSLVAALALWHKSIQHAQEARQTLEIENAALACRAEYYQDKSRLLAAKLQAMEQVIQQMRGV